MKSLRKWASALSALVVLCGSAIAMAAPKPEEGIGFPHDASVDGYKIDWLINVTSIFVVAMFVVMCIWMLLAVLKHGKNHEAQYDHGNSKRAIVIACTISAVIFFVVDGNLFINATLDITNAFWNHAGAESDKSAVRIEVNAHQWAWDVRYAGTDGKFNTADDVVMINEMRVPKDSTIIIQLAAVDVIHSFYLPNFRIKQDAMPGLINRLWFKAKETGEFDIACAQHCGTNHYKMKGLLTVVSKEDFDAWLKEASTNATHGYDENDTDARWGWTWKGI